MIPTNDQELHARTFRAAVEGLPRVLAHIKRRTGLAVQFHPEHAPRLNKGGLWVESNGHEWAIFGVPIAPGDYIVNISGEGIRVVSRREFEQEWEVVGDA